MTGTCRLQMTGVQKRFGPTYALKGVDLELWPGEVLALIGENGAGKSTLMKVLSGAHAPDAGTMHLDGAPYRPKGPADARRAGVAMIYQELSLAGHLTVLENILLGIEPCRGPLIDRRRARQLASDALRQMGLQDIPLDLPVRWLSPAKQQMVEIARAVATRCRVLVLDEPTSSLTHAQIELLFRLIRRLRGQNIAIVYISHFLEEVQDISDRFVVLRDGESVGRGQTQATDLNRIVTMMVGREVSELYPRSHRTQQDDLLLHVKGLAGRDKPLSANLELRRGSVLGIAGLVGAGRTELMRTLFGLDPVKKGYVKIGQFVGPATPRQRWMQGVGMVSEDRKREGLALGLSVADNMTLSHLRRIGSSWFLSPRKQHRVSQPWIDRLAIRCESSSQVVRRLSGGNQQKVALARLLVADVDVLLLDEPTRGIDVGSKAEIYRLIDALASGSIDTGLPPKAILMISSYLPELLGVCDTIAVMARGQMTACRPVAQWDEHSLMLAATGQEAPTGI